ncbi:hypothetical protein [Candidatus Solirubrobacter pratensis]|uniref:hypothetical protein n=1 Tax=Candidatus Solirubrobacter pratensis TaxID=1298857 RepID=UPI0012DD0048|nr:hypothetical protein [Candidatus Solirubrobacter pratensis]
MIGDRLTAAAECPRDEMARLGSWAGPAGSPRMRPRADIQLVVADRDEDLEPVGA